MAQHGDVTSNRIGLTIWWDVNWFSFKQRSVFIQQDILIKNIIPFFFLYGFILQSTLFQTSYWVNLIKVELVNITNYRQLYFRAIQIKNSPILAAKETFTRQKFNLIYPTRLWILRYQTWLIICWFFFKPITRNQLANRFNLVQKKKFQLNSMTRLNAQKVLRTILHFKVTHTGFDLF